MRLVPATLLTLLIGATIAPAHADPYQWCGIYGGGSAVATNCYFVSIAQCRMAVSGNGGYCVPNQFYDGRPVITPGEFVSHRRARG